MRRIPIASLLVAAVALGCTTDQLIIRSGLPGASAAATLEFVAERGDMLDVVMRSGGFRYRFLLPDDAACRSLFTNEQAVTYANTGSLGTLQAGEATCDPVGILSLPEWRDRRPRSRNTSVIPRSQAQLRERVYLDEEVAFIRGRFLLASEIGFSGGGDAIAVIPNSPECQGLTVPGVASMEFRPAGKRAYSLINGGQLCPVIGFARPPPTPAP
jgi:hypothetical protein